MHDFESPVTKFVTLIFVTNLFPGFFIPLLNHRSRYHGVVTTGQVHSFTGLKESPKSLFYHRKLLIKKHLIKRQLHFQRNKITTQWGFVFHAPRFYTEHPTAVHLMLEKLCNILEKKPQQQELFSVLRHEAVTTFCDLHLGII